MGPRFTHPIAKDPDNWVVPAVTFVRVPWADTYGTAPSDDPMITGDGKPWPIWQKGTGVLEIFTEGKGSLLARLSVELTSEDPVTIEFHDADTGDLVHQVVGGLPGWSPDALYEAFRYWGLDDLSFIVSREGVVSNVKPPWPMDEEWIEFMGTVAGRYYTVTLPIGDEFEATAIHLGIRGWDGVAHSRPSPTPGRHGQLCRSGVRQRSADPDRPWDGSSGGVGMGVERRSQLGSEQHRPISGRVRGGAHRFRVDDAALRCHVDLS